MGKYSSSMATAFLLQAVKIAAAAAGLTVSRGCQASCGSVDVPYPFGIGAGCFLPGFEIVCDNGDTPVLPDLPVPGAARPVIKVLRLSVTPRPEAQVTLPVAYQCYSPTGKVTVTKNGNVDLGRPAVVYRISDTANELFVLGCNTFAYTNSDNRPDEDDFAINSGCVATCADSGSARDGACAGIGCCHVDIPRGLTDNQMYFHGEGDKDWSRAGQEDYSPCDYAFIVEKGNYTFRKNDLTSMPLDRAMPLRLDWAIRDGEGSSRSMSCAQAPVVAGYSCVSDHSVCVNSTNGPGYVCNCTQGYEGNPYLRDGCTNIDECKRPRDEFPCNGDCYDTDGSYECRCSSGYESKGNAKENSCHPRFTLAAKLVLGMSTGVFFLVVSILFTFIMLQKRKLDELFKKNGGKILKNVKGLTIYTKEELNKITRNNSEFLGNGSFGQVYKGTLSDDTIVAVKSSIKVNKHTMDEFTKEVEIQTQMIHKNILKLHGCCLEVDVPMLVSEFAAKGSLQEILHGNQSIHFSLDLRLDIAIGSTEGLKYMHSYANEAIRHGDVKPGNILLDEDFTAKISDFGLSKFLKEEYFSKDVVGCMGYIDPVFMKTGLLSQKSDVYSFGVVLLELISRKKIVYDENYSLIIEFRKVYEKQNSGRVLFDEEIATEENILTLEGIGKLAIECLREYIEDRPDMIEAVEQLVMLRRGRKLGKPH